MRHLWLLVFLNVWMTFWMSTFELTVVNGNSENFQDLDNKQSFLLAIFTEDNQRVVFAYALHQFYYTTNLIKSEYFWLFLSSKWPRLVVHLLSQCYDNSRPSSNFAMISWDLAYEWTDTHALEYTWLVSTSLVYSQIMHSHFFWWLGSIFGQWLFIFVVWLRNSLTHNAIQ